jgi:hypothetical protein
MKCKLLLAALLVGTSAFAGTRADIVNAPCTTIDAMMAIVLRQQQKPFAVGASGNDAFDNPGLVSFAYRQLGLDIPADLTAIGTQGKKITTPKKMRRGDIAFFCNSLNPKEIYHLGIVQHINEDGTFNFVCVFPDRGVIIASSTDPGFNGNFMYATRITSDEQIKEIRANYQKDLAAIERAKADLEKAKQAVITAENRVHDLENEFAKNNTAPLIMK